MVKTETMCLSSVCLMNLKQQNMEESEEKVGKGHQEKELITSAGVSGRASTGAGKSRTPLNSGFQTLLCI